jgi:hypothetical protein
VALLWQLFVSNSMVTCSLSRALILSTLTDVCFELTPCASVSLVITQIRRKYIVLTSVIQIQHVLYYSHNNNRNVLIIGNSQS